MYLLDMSSRQKCHAKNDAHCFSDDIIDHVG